MENYHLTNKQVSNKTHTTNTTNTLIQLNIFISYNNINKRLTPPHNLNTPFPFYLAADKSTYKVSIVRGIPLNTPLRYHKNTHKRILMYYNVLTYLRFNVKFSLNWIKARSQ